MSPEFIAITVSFVIWILFMSVGVAILGLADYVYRKDFLNELDKDDNNEWLTGYKKD